MNVESRLFASWTRDVLIAYAGGLVLGAPVALFAAWLTCRDAAVTVSLLAAMSVLFVCVAVTDGTRSGQSASAAPRPVVVRPDHPMARLLGAFLIWEALLWVWPGVASTVLQFAEVGALYVVARG